MPEKDPRTLIWDRPERAAKGPAPSLTRDQVAAAAVSLADDEGIDAVSMRKVADTLGVGAASLYRYVYTKDELHDLMVDWVEGEDGAPPELSGDWRQDLHAFAVRTRTVMLRHPWLTYLAAGRPGFGPNALAWIEYALAAMDPLGTAADDRLVASEVIVSFVRGFVTRELAEPQARARSGLDANAWAHMMGPYIKQIVESGHHPRFAAVVREARLPHEESREAMFLATLDQILHALGPGT